MKIVDKNGVEITVGGYVHSSKHKDLILQCTEITDDGIVHINKDVRNEVPLRLTQGQILTSFWLSGKGSKGKPTPFIKRDNCN